MDALTKLVELQLIKPEKFMDLLDAPDISGFLRSESARIEAIEKIQEEAFYGGLVIQPDPVLGYEEQKESALKIYSRMVKESDKGMDEPKLAGVRKYIVTIKEKQEKIKLEQAKFIAAQGKFGGEVPLPKPPSAGPAKSSEPARGASCNLAFCFQGIGYGKVF